MYTTSTTEEFLAEIVPFNRLSSDALARVSAKARLQRYRMGQPILLRDKMPAQIAILYQGQARLLGYEPGNQLPVTLQLLEPGAVVGWAGLVRSVACETAIAASEAVCLILPAFEFLEFLQREEEVADYFHSHAALVEVFELLGAELQQRADRELILKNAGATDLKELVVKLEQTEVCNVSLDKRALSQLDPDWLWLVSGGSHLPDLPIGSHLHHKSLPGNRPSTGTIRLVGFPKMLTPTVLSASLAEISLDAIPYAPDQPPEPDFPTARPKTKQYPYVRGRGNVQSTLACFQMLAQHLGLPFRRDVIHKVLVSQHERTGSSLLLCGAVAELVGLNAQLVSVPIKAVSRLQTPALIAWQESFAVLYEISEKIMVLGVPEVGIRRYKPAD